LKQAARGDIFTGMTPAQCRAARALLDWTLDDLAKAAAVGVNTVSRYERGGDAMHKTVQAIRGAMEAAGVMFIPSNGGGPGVRLKGDTDA
jgi:transcriptional regulator with XRE-family HTH domain